MDVAGVIGMPVVLHCDVDSLNNQGLRPFDIEGHEPSHLVGLRAFFGHEEVKNTNIVWAHAGGLGRFIDEPNNHIEVLDKMLQEHPNLSLDISWSQVANKLTSNPEKQELWTNFIEKNSSRILFGSDALSPQDNQTWDQTREIYKNLLGSLSDEARASILHGNYERIFVDARPKVREFENNVLTDKFVNENLRDVNGPRTVATALRAHIAEQEQQAAQV